MTLDAENHIELYEAVYFFNKIIHPANAAPKGQGLTTSVHNAVMRILVVNKLLNWEGNRFVKTLAHREKHQHILRAILGRNQSPHYGELFRKAQDPSQFFFSALSEPEEEVYARCNFPVTARTGKKVVRHVDFSGAAVLELGGNSGGLASAIVRGSKQCRYTVVDRATPCAVGEEFNKANHLDITFTEGDIFDIGLASKAYDYIILMNVLHDFDDENCLRILRNCLDYFGAHTRLLIIEDMLTGEFEPREVVMHGLRLSVECRGGRQRTVPELVDLLAKVGCQLEQLVRLDKIHSMMTLCPLGLSAPLAIQPPPC